MPFRKDLVEETARGYKNRYPTQTYDQVAKIGEDRGIAIYDARILFVSATIWLPQQKEPVIVIRKNPFKRVRTWELGHELGHALLDHIDFNPGPDLEGEADLFAKLLIGPKPNLGINIASLWPIASRYSEISRFFSDPEFEKKLLRRELNYHGLTL